MCSCVRERNMAAKWEKSLNYFRFLCGTFSFFTLSVSCVVDILEKKSLFVAPLRARLHWEGGGGTLKQTPGPVWVKVGLWLGGRKSPSPSPAVNNEGGLFSHTYATAEWSRQGWVLLTPPPSGTQNHQCNACISIFHILSMYILMDTA